MEKKRIVREVNSGLLGQRAAARKYGLSRNNVSAWIDDYSSFAIKPDDVVEEADSDMTESAKTRILAKQVENLTKQLAKTNLKIGSLQTLIEKHRKLYFQPSEYLGGAQKSRSFILKSEKSLVPNS